MNTKIMNRLQYDKFAVHDCIKLILRLTELQAKSASVYRRHGPFKDYDKAILETTHRFIARASQVSDVALRCRVLEKANLTAMRIALLGPEQSKGKHS